MVERIFNWIVLLCNIAFIISLAYTLVFLFIDELIILQITMPLSFIAILICYICVRKAAETSYQASHQVKSNLRHLIYEKVITLGLD